MSHRLILRIIERTYPGELVAYRIHPYKPLLSEIIVKIKNPVFVDRILYMLDLMLKDAQSNSLQEKLA